MLTRTIVVLAGVWSMLAWAAPAPAAGADGSSAEALGQVYAELAYMRVPTAMKSEIDPDDDPSYREAVSLLRAAMRLEPTEPLHARHLADYLMRLRQTAATSADLDTYTAGAIEALNAFRRLRPDDQVSQWELIDLYASRMETLHDRLKYLRDLLGREAVPAEVRSLIAYRCAQLLSDQGRRSEAREMLETSVRLNPLNVSAQSAIYLSLGDAKQQTARVERLLAILRANPVARVGDDFALNELAAELAAAGLVKDSVTWYGQGAKAARIGRFQLPRGTALAYAAQLYLNEQVDQSAGLLELILAGGDDYTALALRMLCEKRLVQRPPAPQPGAAGPTTAPAAGSAEQYAALRVRARNVLVGQLAEIRSAMGAPAAATRPAGEEQPLPDLAADLERLKSARPEIRALYRQVARDLAWHLVYFDDRPADAEKVLKVVTAIGVEETDNADAAALRKDLDIFAARITGWAFLRAGKTAEARVKLSAAAAEDPMAALGLVRIDAPAQRAEAKAAAEKLLAEYRGGVLAVLLLDGLRDALPGETLRIVPAPEAKPILAALDAFPIQWMKTLDRPATAYLLRAEPLKVIHGYAEPMLVRLVIQSNSDFDVTIGPDGLIQPMVMFNAQLGGLFRKGGVLPGVVFERVTDRIVLRPRQTISRIVRFDRGDLARVLENNPTPPISVIGDVWTNAIGNLTTGEAACGPGGYAADFSRVLERSAFPFRPDSPEASLRPVMDAIASGDGRERIRNLRLLSVLATLMRGQKENAEMVKLGESLLPRLDAVRNDPDLPVRAWANYLYAVFGPEASRAATIEKMASDAAWQIRLLGMTAVAVLPADRQKPIFQAVARSETEPLVRDFALASLEGLSRAPATAPAATRPAAGAR